MFASGITHLISTKVVMISYYYYCSHFARHRYGMIPQKKKKKISLIGHLKFNKANRKKKTKKIFKNN